MKIRFDALFQHNGDDFYTPKCKVQIGKATIGPEASFSAGTTFSGFCVAKHAGLYLDVHRHPNGVIEILKNT